MVRRRARLAALVAALSVAIRIGLDATSLATPGALGTAAADRRARGLELGYNLDYPEALAAFHRLCRTEGIVPALESSHALARALDTDAELIAVCLSGRGDKDLAEVLAR